MTLQRRVLGYLALAAIASCALTVVVAVVLVRHRVAAQRMSALKAQADLLATATSTPGDHVYRFSGAGPRPLGPEAAAQVLSTVARTGSSQGTIELGRVSVLFAIRSSIAGRVVVVRPASLAFGEWGPFLVSLVLSGLGGVVLALLLSYMLARRLTRPIGELARATRRVARGESVAVPLSDDRELAELGRSFNEMSAQLSAARESQQQFLESVSHELKTPLTSIRGYAEAVQEGAIPPHQGTEVIRGEAARLERLVADLLDLGRFRRAEFAVERRPVDVAALVERAVARHAPQARDLGVALERRVADGAAVLGDEERLLQVLSNLVENALRLTPAGGQVTVEATGGEIAVSDTGPGLEDQDLPRAFDRFYLHDRYRTERPVGSGLGLAIVKQLVSAAGGSVEATRADGGGAKFVVRLPRPSPTQPLPAPPGAGRPCA